MRARMESPRDCSGLEHPDVQIAPLEVLVELEGDDLGVEEEFFHDGRDLMDLFPNLRGH